MGTGHATVSLGEGKPAHGLPVFGDWPYFMGDREICCEGRRVEPCIIITDVRRKNKAIRDAAMRAAFR